MELFVVREPIFTRVHLTQPSRILVTSLVLLLDLYASRQTQVFEYLFEISLEALRELSFDGPRGLNSDFEI